MQKKTGYCICKCCILGELFSVGVTVMQVLLKIVYKWTSTEASRVLYLASIKSAVCRIQLSNKNLVAIVASVSIYLYTRIPESYISIRPGTLQ